MKAIFLSVRKMVGVRGVEPRTLRLSSACSNQLSYTPKPRSKILSPKSKVICIIASNFGLWTLDFGLKLVELRRFELLTYSLQSYRSTN